MIGSTLFQLFLCLGMVSTLTVDLNAKYKKCMSSDFYYVTERKASTVWCKKFCHITGYSEKYVLKKADYDSHDWLHMFNDDENFVTDKFFKVYNEDFATAEQRFLDSTTKRSFIDGLCNDPLHLSAMHYFLRWTIRKRDYRNVFSGQERRNYMIFANWENNRIDMFCQSYCY
ncbi:Uncharacterised protein at_DN1946 [Pycnogonum litorale]